jgi:hypothetical protein
MAKFSVGKYAKFISDRSGQQFPYSERVKEWNGSVVHISEYEPKQPQLNPRKIPPEPQALYQPRPARREPLTVSVGNEVFPPYEGGTTQAVGQVGVVTITTS